MDTNEFKLDATPRTRSLSIAFRNAGYTNYAAIADIIDNSLETNVDAKNVRVNTILEGIKGNKVAKEIQIADDGCGMDFATLREALKIGSDTGKNAVDDLGCYGIGMKSAAISIGQKFEVWTKSFNDRFLIAVYDVEEMTSSDSYEIPGRYGTDAEWEEFKGITKSDTGTIIRITKIDRMNTDNFHYFETQLLRKLGEYFAIFIEDSNINFFVNEKKVEPVDVIGEKRDGIITLSNNEDTEFTFNGSKVKLVAYYLPKDIRGKQSDDIYMSTKGMYIYRNKRLVGRALSLGLIRDDNWYNGLRIKVFINGASDRIFNTSFTKVIHERDKASLDQGFKDKIESRINYWLKESRILQKLETPSNTVELNNKEQEIIKPVLEEANTNRFVGINAKRYGKNNKNIEPVTPPHTHRGAQINPPEHRVRKEIKIADVQFLGQGQFERAFDVNYDMGNGKKTIYINTDHAFYNKFYALLDDTNKRMAVRLILSMYFAQASIMQYSTTDTTKEEKSKIMEEFISELSREFRLQTDETVV